MRLRLLQRNWEKMGATDPLWAVATAPQYKGGKWDEDAFFATGRAGVDEVLKWSRDHGLGVATQRALDFGCGVGRLTQALGEHFQEVVGLDIAPSMIEHADRYNRLGSRCTYVLNERADLTIFPDNHFDFVLSEITLMHMEPRYSMAYVREFVRVTRSTGLIVFQMPSRSWRQAIRQRIPGPLWEAVTTLRTWRTPRMEVYGCERSEIEAEVRAAGGAILGEEPIVDAAYHNYNARYYVTPAARLP